MINPYILQTLDEINNDYDKKYIIDTYEHLLFFEIHKQTNENTIQNLEFVICKYLTLKQEVEKNGITKDSKIN